MKKEFWSVVGKYMDSTQPICHMVTTKIVIDADKRTLPGGIGTTMTHDTSQRIVLGTAFAKINKEGDFN